ncbi:MAG: 2-oxoacid:ferredoxin oxidoreductase subunit beta [Flavobacteriales bacterium]
MTNKNTINEQLKPKDFETDQDVRWCPGCGDYSILKQTQKVMSELGLQKEEMVFISGIGCSSRFPYYMDSYGIHGIHGRAPAICTGLVTSRPDLSVWLITGDGDGLSIGGNHFIHILRRNVNVNMLLFNNEVYGLTKGQYSPTSPQGQKSASTPQGSLDHPFNPVALAFGADGTYIARTVDREPRHMRDILKNSEEHKGTSFVEIYQNCNVYNDGAFFTFTDKKVRDIHCIFLKDGEPMVFGKENEKGIKLDGAKPVVVDLNEDSVSKDELWVHDTKDEFKASILTRFFDDPKQEGALPRPFGVFYDVERECYEDAILGQIQQEKQKKGEGDLDELLRGPSTWEV